MTREGHGYYNSNLTALGGAELRQSGTSPLGRLLDGAGSEGAAQLIGDAVTLGRAEARIIPFHAPPRLACWTGSTGITGIAGVKEF